MRDDWYSMTKITNESQKWATCFVIGNQHRRSQRHHLVTSDDESSLAAYCGMRMSVFPFQATVATWMSLS
eukprot:scaffold13930_cov34-Prasinocladus_malaysianus.AAC.2